MQLPQYKTARIHKNLLASERAIAVIPPNGQYGLHASIIYNYSLAC
jgi:hypothetical protein